MLFYSTNKAVPRCFLALFSQQEHRPRGSATPQWGGKIERPNDNQQRCRERGGGGHDHPNDNHPPHQGIEKSATTQTTIIRRLGGGGRDDDHTTQMTISRAGEGGEAGASCLLPKRQSTGAPGQGRGGGGRATCPNCPNDNQPQLHGWRRATVWGGGAAAGRCSTPWHRPALW
jgi:hypothetical protein